MPGATGSGLPYAVGTDPVRDGDNAIKNLATALDRRGYGYRTEVRTVVVTPNAAGGWGLSYARPFAGGQVIVAATCYNAAAGYVPVLAFNNVDVNGFSGVMANAMTGQAITIGTNIFYIAVGWDPDV